MIFFFLTIAQSGKMVVKVLAKNLIKDSGAILMCPNKVPHFIQFLYTVYIE